MVGVVYILVGEQAVVIGYCSQSSCKQHLPTKAMASQQKLEALIDLFNEKSKSELLLTKKCSELKEGKHYIIHSLKKMETSVGDAVLAKLGDAPFVDGDLPKFQIFLPKRFVHSLQNKDLDSIAPGALYLVSNGQCSNNSVELKMYLV